MVRARYDATLAWFHQQPSKQPDLMSLGALVGWACLALFGGVLRLRGWDHLPPYLVIAVQVVRAWHIESLRWRFWMSLAGFVLWTDAVMVTVRFVGWTPTVAAGIGFALLDLTSVTRHSVFWSERPLPGTR